MEMKHCYTIQNLKNSDILPTSSGAHFCSRRQNNGDTTPKQLLSTSVQLLQKIKIRIYVHIY